jgi:hypothetical protein
VYLGASWCELLDGTEMGDELGTWGPSAQDFGSALATFSGHQDATGSTGDSSEASNTLEDEDDFTWAMEAMQLGEHSGRSTPYLSESDSADSVIHPPAKRKRPCSFMSWLPVLLLACALGSDSQHLGF